MPAAPVSAVACFARVAVAASPAADIFRKFLRVDSPGIFPLQITILNFGEYTTAQCIFLKCEENIRGETLTIRKYSEGPTRSYDGQS